MSAQDEGAPYCVARAPAVSKSSIHFVVALSGEFAREVRYCNGLHRVCRCWSRWCLPGAAPISSASSAPTVVSACSRRPTWSWRAVPACASTSTATCRRTSTEISSRPENPRRWREAECATSCARHARRPIRRRVSRDTPKASMSGSLEPSTLRTCRCSPSCSRSVHSRACTQTTQQWHTCLWCPSLVASSSGSLPPCRRHSTVSSASLEASSTSSSTICLTCRMRHLHGIYSSSQTAAAAACAGRATDVPRGNSLGRSAAWA